MTSSQMTSSDGVFLKGVSLDDVCPNGIFLNDGLMMFFLSVKWSIKKDAIWASLYMEL